MIRIRITAALFAVLAPLTAQAQRDTVHDRSDIEWNFARTLWSAGGNAAGLHFAPLHKFNAVDASYAWRDGTFARRQEGTGQSTLRFDTQGALQAGKFQLWGRFAYHGNTVRSSSYNTLVYDPLDERFLYNVADTVDSRWKKQSYAMECKAALPLIPDRLAAGLHLEYSDRLAAKQNDPRSESYNYEITLKPSLAFRAERSVFGAYGRYSNLFERTTPTLSNGSEPQKVFVLKGLGNYINETVGQSGLGTMYYLSNAYGGGLSYGLDAGVRLLADVGFTSHRTMVRQTATIPRKMGSTRVNALTASFQLLYGQDFNQKLTATFLRRDTDGTDYTTVWNTKEGIWEVASSAVTSTYATTAAGLAWEKRTFRQGVRRWSFRAALDWEDKQDTYLLPESRFSYDNLQLNAAARRNIQLSRSALEFGASACFRKNLAGGYSYSGSKSAAATVRDWYPHDARVMTSDFLCGGLCADWTFPTRKRLCISLHAEASVLGTLKTGLNRLLSDTGISLIF